MRVLHIPDGRKYNPYQIALGDSLLREGVDVRFGTLRCLFSVLWSCRSCWKPDIVHLHWSHPFTLGSTRLRTVIKSVSFIGELLMLRLLRIRIVWTVHNIVSHERAFVSLELFFNRVIAGFCNRIIVHSASAKNEVISVYGASGSLVTVIPHGNYMDYYPNVVSKAQAKRQLQLSMGDVVFLHFGQVRPYKGVLELIDAFKQLSHGRATLLIVGKPLNDEVAHEILEKCGKDKKIKTVFDFIPINEVQIYMNAADVVVLPYRDILTSGAVILAMSFGKPVIAPAVGYMLDVLGGEETFLYDPLVEDGLLAALRRALDADLAKTGKRNVELAEQLRWDDIATRTYEVYRGCLPKKRKR